VIDWHEEDTSGVQRGFYDKETQRHTTRLLAALVGNSVLKSNTWERFGWFETPRVLRLLLIWYVKSWVLGRTYLQQRIFGSNRSSVEAMATPQLLLEGDNNKANSTHWSPSPPFAGITQLDSARREAEEDAEQ